MALASVRTRLLLLAVAVTVATTSASAAAPRFFLPDSAASAPLAPLVQQLEALGLERFEEPTPDAQAEPTLTPSDPWTLLLASHAEIAVVWTTQLTSPPFADMRFPARFQTKLNRVPALGERLSSGRDALAAHIQSLRQRKGSHLYRFMAPVLQLPRDEGTLAATFQAAARRAKEVAQPLNLIRDPALYQRFLVRALPVDDGLSHNDAASEVVGLVASVDELRQLQATRTTDQRRLELSAYVEPLLLDGRRFTVGLYVTVTSVDPLRIYVHEQALVKVATQMYPVDRIVNAATTDRAAYVVDDEEYLSPWDLPDLQPDFHELPSGIRPGTNAWRVVQRALQRRGGVDTTRLQQEMEAAVVRTIAGARSASQRTVEALVRTHPAAPDGEDDEDIRELDAAFFEMWRFDFQVDDMGHPWLERTVSDPSLVPRDSVVASDAGVKTAVARDLVRLIGAHPEAQPDFTRFFRTPPDAARFCRTKCADRARVWATTCWACPGWLAPYVARRLFTGVHEHARRGGFRMVFPSPDYAVAGALDDALTEHDLALDRYVQSLSAGYADPEARNGDGVDEATGVVCVHRVDCSHHGDCVNGRCECDAHYEGATCYIRMDAARERAALAAQVVAAEVEEVDEVDAVAVAGEDDDALDEDAGKQSWRQRMQRLWNGAASTPAPAQGAHPEVDTEDDGAMADGEALGLQAKSKSKNKPTPAPTLSELDRFSAASLVLALGVLAMILVLASRLYVLYAPPSVSTAKQN